MQNSSKFKFPYDTRNSEQVNGKYKDVVHKFLNSDAAPMTGKLMKLKNVRPYRVMQHGFSFISLKLAL